MSKQPTTDDLEDYWASYYRGVVKGGQHWLDYSNGRVQAQTFALALEAAGPVTGLRCLDIGCGWGQLTRLLGTLGAVEPTGVDIVPELIASLAETHPGYRWVCGSPTDVPLLESLSDFDVVFAIEVLQAVPLEPALRALWDRVVPGGRLVGVMANAACPIVQHTQERFPEKYHGLDVDTVRSVVGGLSDVDAFSLRGMFFQDDQRIAPYQAGPWETAPSWRTPPNRIQFVVQKTG
jgi:SAM-dependent methyltransferase